MTDRELVEAVRQRALDGKLQCKIALELADEFEVSPGKIGRICNDEDIRIINCQLGCFGATPKRRES